MILVDSSAWISYFSDSSSPVASFLEDRLEHGRPVSLIPVVMTEVLMGFRSDLDFRRARRLLERVPQLPLSTGTHVRAAALFRTLRRQGVTIRGAIDCLIAAVCMEHHAELLTLDRDFHRIAVHSSLRLVDPT